MSVATSSAPLAVKPPPRLQSRTSTSSIASSSSSSRPVAAGKVPVPRVSAKPPLGGSPSNVGQSTSSGVARASKVTGQPGPPATSASSSSFIVPGKDTSSSAGKVFAKPSKEWVLPERAKPGRKVSVEEPDSKRQSQNRLSQRAHRARRTDYISTLEERLRQFENDEIHSNVRLQEVARALKADNERLKAELLAANTLSEQKRAAHTPSPAPKGWEDERRMLLAEVTSLRSEVKVLRESLRSFVPLMGGTGGPVHGVPPFASSSATPLALPAVPNGRHSTLGGSRQGVADCPICPNPDPDCPCQHTATSLHPTANDLDYRLRATTRHPDPSIPLGSTIDLRHSPPLLPLPVHHSCGVCRNVDECLCRALDEEDADVKPIILTPPSNAVRLEEMCGLCVEGGFCACAVARASPKSPQVSLAPSRAVVPSTAAVPLKRLRNPAGIKKPIWALSVETEGTEGAANGAGPRGEAVCTGDPNNCDACRNDSFGQEFCANFFQPRDPSHACANCSGQCGSSRPTPSAPAPNHAASTRCQATNAVRGDHTPPAAAASAADPDPESALELDVSAPLLLSCCGSPHLCSHSSGTGGCTGNVIGIGGLIPGITSSQAERETIRVDQAWKQLKAHPNAKFASLALLADIVAQRTPDMPHPLAAPQPRLKSQSQAQSRTDVGGTMGRIDEAGSKGGRAVVDGGKDVSSIIESAIGERDSDGVVVTDARGSASDIKGRKRMVVETSALRDALRVLDGTPVPSEDDEPGRKRHRIRE